MTLDEIATLCRVEYPRVVKSIFVFDPRRNRIRIELVDGSFLDIHQTSEGRYSYHWEREDGFYRFNNAPHFDHIESAPHHLHIGNERVIPSDIRGVTEDSVRKVLQFVEEHLTV